MKIDEVAGVGKIVKGVNTTPDVQPGETERQAKKFFGGTGKPKKLVSSKTVANSTPNKLFNLGLAEKEDKEELKGFDPRTVKAINNLMIKFPQAKDPLSAIIADIEDSQEISIANDKHTKLRNVQQDKQIDDLTKRVDKLEKGNVTEDEDMSIIQRAEQFAQQAHKDHKRKYTGDPYYVHLDEVRRIVKAAGGSENMQAAALLHDTVEDTNVTSQDIMQEFGPAIAKLVVELTDISKPEDGNRATRKAMDRDKLAGASADAQTIKYADLISNGRDIGVNDPKFAKVYHKEKAELLRVMRKGDSNLRNAAVDMLPDELRTIATENLSYTGTERRRLEKKKGIEVGTPEWFKHWFDLPYLREGDAITYDELVKKARSKYSLEYYIKGMMRSLHSLVTSGGNKHSIGYYAQEVGRQFGFNGRDLEKMYRKEYDTPETGLNKRFSESTIQKVDIKQLETFADKLFGKVGIDVEFTKHFMDRVNDIRNQKPITTSELTRLFKQEYKRWGKPIAQLGPDSEAVMKDLQTDINLPFVLKWDSKNNELDLVAKTVMRKADFKTNDREFPVESVPIPVTKKQAAINKQSQAALLKSKIEPSKMVDRMTMVNKGMQNKVNQTQADANKLSKAAGIDPNLVNKQIKQSFSQTPNPQLKSRFGKKFENVPSTNKPGTMGQHINWGGKNAPEKPKSNISVARRNNKQEPMSWWQKTLQRGKSLFDDEQLDLKKKFKITDELKQLDKIFQSKNREIRIVGGAVRDLALGKTPKDIDLATDATPDEMQRMFDSAGVKHIPTGIEHGTITAVLNGEPYEITTLRADVETDGRRAEVEFVRSWEEDAKRRDLTYNAMSMDFDGNLYDYHGGMDDLQDKVTRFVGDPEERIKEDYLRTLRYFRFQGRLDTPTFDRETMSAIASNVDGLKQLSVERVWMEMSKILGGGNIQQILSAMDKTGVLGAIGLNAKPSQNLMDGGDPIINLARITDDESIGPRWKMSNEEKGKLGFLISQKGQTHDKKWYTDQMVDGFDRTQLDALARYNNQDDMIAHIKSFKAPEFPVDGNDLMQLGHSRGPGIGKTLMALRNKWKQGNFTATKDELLKNLTEGAEVTVWTNPEYQGADVDTDYYNKQPAKLIGIDKLVPFEPADKMDDKNSAANLSQFVKHIQAGGKINPIVITKHEGKWLILDGHHRYFASLKAGVDKMRVVVADPKNLTYRDDVPVEEDQEFNELDYVLKKQVKPSQAVMLTKLGKFHNGADELEQIVPERKGKQYALHPDNWKGTYYSLTNKDTKKIGYYRPKVVTPPAGSMVADMAIANQFYRTNDEDKKQQLAQAYKDSMVEYGADISHIKFPEILMPGVNEVEEGKEIKTKKKPDGFTIDLVVDGKQVGQYTHAREDDIVRNQAEIFPEYRNKGYGTMLLLAAIKTADDLGLDFEEDTQSLTPAMSRIYDELDDSGMIYGGNGAWAISPSGESELEDFLNENFADGKKKGKSRPGRVKRAGASCKGSVTSLRKKAKNSSGEKAKMYHWCANMKSGKNKSK